MMGRQHKYPYFATALVFLVGLAVLSGCKPKKDDNYLPEYDDSAPQGDTQYIFGIHPLHNPQHMFAAYGPLVDYLNHHLKGARIRLEASRDYGSFEQKLYGGHFQFALPNPYQALVSTQHGYHFFGKVGNDADFRGIILIRKDRPLSSIADLRGKSISYPAPTALAATLLPQWFLHENGIDVTKDVQNLYVGSQESSIMNVYLGKTVAGATWPPPWRAFAAEHPEIASQLVVRWQTTSLVNNALVVRDDVPPALVAQVSDLLFNLRHTSEGAAILSAAEVSDFEPADSTTYLPVTQFLTRFEREVRPLTVEQK